MNWGTSMTAIKSYYGTHYLLDSNTLLYKSNNGNVPYYIYIFENGKLKYSSAIVKLSASSALVDFLAERYLTVSVNTSTYTATYAHCYGKKTDPKCDYGVAFTYNSSIGGLLVAYAPISTSNSTSNSKLNFTIVNNNYTRANMDMSKYIEEIFVKNNIKVE